MRLYFSTRKKTGKKAQKWEILPRRILSLKLPDFKKNDDNHDDDDDYDDANDDGDDHDDDDEDHNDNNDDDDEEEDEEERKIKREAVHALRRIFAVSLTEKAAKTRKNAAKTRKNKKKTRENEGNRNRRQRKGKKIFKDVEKRSGNEREV